MTSPDQENPTQSTATTHDPEFDRQQTFDLESVKRKQRADSFFQRLTPQQQEQLVHWVFEIETVSALQARISAPPPQGFGMKVHYTSLQRFRSNYRARVFANHQEEILDTIRDMETEGDFSQSARIQKGINQLLHQHAFELARTHPGSEIVPRLLASIEKLSAIELKRQKLLHGHTKNRNHPSSPLTTHHRVELSIVPASGTVQNIITVQPEQPKLPEPSNSETPAQQEISPKGKEEKINVRD